MPKRLVRGRGIEISGLTRNNPAQPGANVVGMKSEDKPLHQKNDFTALLSSATDGHRHTMSLDIYRSNPDGLTSYEFTSQGRYHDHKLRFDDNGDIQFYETNENVPDLHTHTVPIEEAISYVTAKLVRKTKSLSSSDARSKAKALLEEIVASSSIVSSGNSTKGNNKMTPEEIANLQEKAAQADFLQAEKEKLPLMSEDVAKHYDSLAEDKKERIHSAYS